MARLASSNRYGEVEFQLLQKFRYYDFPFDRHVIRIEYVTASCV